MTKDRVLNLRVSYERRSSYERAAAIEGATLTTFMTSAADERVDKVLAAHASTTVSSSAFDRLLAALDRPPRSLAHSLEKALTGRQFENK